MDRLDPGINPLDSRLPHAQAPLTSAVRDFGPNP
jgi:hypothetical protein